MIGFVVGKFYPPHLGHHYLIDTALGECDHVIVLVAGSDVESISMEKRAEWLQKEHPRAQVITALDNYPVDYESDHAWENHVNLFSKAVAQANDFAVTDFYCSEQWGHRMASMLSNRDGRGQVQAHIVDSMRSAFPISASKIRADIVSHWDFLRPSVKADLCLRVVICGAESTGTTTLAKALAEKYNTVCVPEYGRHFDWAMGKNHKWTHEDFMHIAKEQQRWENDLARYSGPILICDTDAYATAMFHEVYLGYSHIDLMRLAKDGNRSHGENLADLYFITSHVNVPFEDDGTRFNSGKRPWMTQWFQDNLPYHREEVLTGAHVYPLRGGHRVVAASEIIDRAMFYNPRWIFRPPLEYS